MSGTNVGDAIRVDLVMDVICVHSYLGFTRFERAAEDVRAAGHRLEVSIRPYQVVPDAPQAGMPLTERHRQDFGPDAAQIVAPMKQLAAAEGLEFNFERAVFVNTFRAHLLLRFFDEHGLGEVAARRLFRAYFTDGLNVGDPEVLHTLGAELAADHPGIEAPTAAELAGDESDGGLAKEVHEDLQRVRADGITAVPALVVAGGATLTGARTQDEYAAALVV